MNETSTDVMEMLLRKLVQVLMDPLTHIIEFLVSVTVRERVKLF